MENVSDQKCRKLQKNSKDNKLKSICIEMFRLKLAEQTAKEKYAELQSKLKGYFEKSSEKGLQYSVDGKSYRVTNVEPVKLIRDVEKLKSQLKQHDVETEIINSVIETSYSISDWKKFVEILSSHGIKAKEVLPIISTQKKVNQKKIDEMSELGYITTEDIDGCYTIEKTNGYCKLTEFEQDDE